MEKYAYQINGALENAQGHFIGLRILVCNSHFINLVDVPADILDIETHKYIQFRLTLTDEALNIQALPYKIQRAIREPLGLWLDRWVLENLYGDTGNPKSINS
jgi:hypothetical protein